MYQYHEIEIENQQDFFSRLYLFLAREMLTTCGRGGEGALREAVRRFGAVRGRELKEKHIQAGWKTNLQSYQLAGDNAQDTRERGTTLKLTEEVCLREVYTCPRADLWAKYAFSEIGLWYCEEFERAKFLAYTDGKGQPNLSERLTCPRENHCRFSLYYRRFNTAPEAIERSFSSQTSPAIQPAASAEFHLSLAELCLRLTEAVLGVATERFGREGESAVANGLRLLAVEQSMVLKRQAEYTSNACDARYIAANFPLRLHLADQPDLSDCCSTDAATLLQTNLLDRMQEMLAIIE